MLAELAKARGDVAGRRQHDRRARPPAGGAVWLVLAALADLGGLVAVRGDEARAVALHAERRRSLRRTG